MSSIAAVPGASMLRFLRGMCILWHDTQVGATSNLVGAGGEAFFEIVLNQDTRAYWMTKRTLLLLQGWVRQHARA